jgi:transcription elongation factor Elf1
MCPECESEDVEAMEIDENEPIVYMICNNCEHEFEEEE